MLLKKECDYGLRAIRALVGGEIKTVKYICELEHIPHDYGYKILKKLQKAGLVQNKRGPAGGYFLIKPLDSFTLYDVVSAVDSKLFLLDCLRTGVYCTRNTQKAPCKIHQELARIQNLMVSELESKTMDKVLQIKINP